MPQLYGKCGGGIRNLFKGTAFRKLCSSGMRSLLGIFVVVLLSLPITARAQLNEDSTSSVLWKPISLDSFIHYPEEAVKKRIEGKVEIQAVIETDGSVREAKIENSSDPVFNTEAIRVIITNHFEHDPSIQWIQDRMVVNRTITFDLNNKRSLITTSHTSDEYSMLVLVGWSKKNGLIYDDSKLQNIADLDPAAYDPHEIFPLDSLIKYPKVARKKGIEGKVIVQALIDKDDGSVSKVEIFKSDNPLLNDEAIRVLKTARFSPSSANGWTLRTLTFNLKANPNAYKLPSPIRDYEYGEGEGKFGIGVSQEPHEITPLEKLIHYPEEAKRNGIEGKVTLQALINKKGSIDSVILLKTSDSIFDKEAIRVMKSARYTPAMQDSTPIKVWITRRIDFRLKE
jgi:TonB family protein